MKFIKAEFIAGDQVYDDTAAYAGRKSKYIDKTVHFCSLYVTPPGFKVIDQHKSDFIAINIRLCLYFQLVA